MKAAPSRKYQHLFISICLDLLGMFTYAIPLLGEIGDVVFAPLYALAIFIMYRKRKLPAAVGAFVGAVEEWLPGTDIIPSATIMWVYVYLGERDKVG
ncbi:MAG: hypothetical protein GYB31_07760 [Bacteroidetes bacterium]|nr:hypothetical protein [Bacteroidota bacterium]